MPYHVMLLYLGLSFILERTYLLGNRRAHKTASTHGVRTIQCLMWYLRLKARVFRCVSNHDGSGLSSDYSSHSAKLLSSASKLYNVDGHEKTCQIIFNGSNNEAYLFKKTIAFIN